MLLSRGSGVVLGSRPDNKGTLGCCALLASLF